MKNTLLTVTAAAFLVMAGNLQAVEGNSSPYTDAAGDIDAGISTGGGTLDILGMEVTNNATDITFTLTVNGNVSTTDWGKFMVGIATGKTDGTLTGNGWARPINLSYDNDPFAVEIIGMNYWIGSWVDGGGGAQLFNYNGSGWDQLTNNAPGFSFSGGATSTLSYTATLASLGLAVNDTFYFDAYSSGGGGTDSAVDALANPNVSITAWAGPYTSYATAAGGPGLNSYQVVPEPSTVALLTLSALGVAGYAARRRARK